MCVLVASLALLVVLDVFVLTVRLECVCVACGARCVCVACNVLRSSCCVASWCAPLR